MATPRKKPEVPQVKAIEERWTKPLADAGWTALPNVVLDKQAVLGLDPMDVNIILQIAKYWWQPESAPYPGVERLAEAIGVHVRTIQKHITRLVDAGCWSGTLSSTRRADRRAIGTRSRG